MKKKIVEEEHLHLDVVEVSLNSVVWFIPNHILKIMGRIKEQDVLVLINSGATHNFISNKAVYRLRLCLTDTGSFWVVIVLDR